MLEEIKRKHQYGEHPLTTEELNLVFQELENLKEQRNACARTSFQLQHANERYKEDIKQLIIDNELLNEKLDVIVKKLGHVDA